MTDLSDETREEYLVRNIAEVNTQRMLLQNKPFGIAIANKDDALRRQVQIMTAELEEIRAGAKE